MRWIYRDRTEIAARPNINSSCTFHNMALIKGSSVYIQYLFVGMDMKAIVVFLGIAISVAGVFIFLLQVNIVEPQLTLTRVSITVGGIILMVAGTALALLAIEKG